MSTQSPVTLSAQELWRQALVLLQAQVSHSNYETWLLKLTPLSLSHGVLTLSSPNVFTATYLINHQAFLIEKVLFSIAGQPITFRIQPPRGPAVENIAGAGEESNSTRIVCPVCNLPQRTEGWRSWHLTKYHPGYLDRGSPAHAAHQYAPEEV